jgi:hypothetical protein
MWTWIKNWVTTLRYCHFSSATDAEDLATDADFSATDADNIATYVDALATDADYLATTVGLFATAVDDVATDEDWPATLVDVLATYFYKEKSDLYGSPFCDYFFESNGLSLAFYALAIPIYALGVGGVLPPVAFMFFIVAA